MKTIQAIAGTRMAPKSSSALPATSFDANMADVSLSQEEVVPVPRPDELNIYSLPKGLNPVYTSLPLVVRFGLGVLSAWSAALTTFDGKLIWLRPLTIAAKQQAGTRKMLSFIFKTCIIFLISNLALQEIFAPPSRISTQDMIDRYFLPSKLSKYETVNLPNGQSLGVHSLQYDCPTVSGTGKEKYSALYLNHGFGASSLSWLPVIPKLAKRLKIKKTFAHDAVGFGFTDRPENVALYRTSSSSEIGLQVFNNNKKADDTNASSSVLLMGHSMGSFATLEMASKMPEDVSVTVVLVAPALGLSPRKEMNSSPPSAVGDFLQSYIVGPPVCYFLRRVVGINGFWKRGLQSVWGDSELVTDSDALRFQWPSIGKGWERGLLRFAHAMTGVSDGQDLVKLVANRRNTRIVVVLGEKDKVISRRTIEKVFSQYPNIPIVEVAGSGHDPFEEKIDDFIDLVEKVLGE